MVTGSLAHWGHWGPPKVDLTWLSKKKENKDESGRLSGGLGFLGNMRSVKPSAKVTSKIPSR